MQFEVTIKPSRMHFWLCVGVYSAALVALLFSSLPAYFFYTVSLLLIIGLYFFVRSGYKKKIKRIRINSIGWVVRIDQCWLLAMPEEIFYFSSYLLVIPLSIKYEKEIKRRCLFIFRDNLTCDAWCRLRCSLLSASVSNKRV